MGKCKACNGTGRYDNTGSPLCSACGGTGEDVSLEKRLEISEQGLRVMARETEKAMKRAEALEAELAEANEKLKKVETELVKTNELNGFLQDRIRELLKVENTRLCIYCQTRIPSIDEYGEYQQVCKKCFKRFHEGL